MEPKVGQVWEWDIDREHLSVFTIVKISATTHDSEVLCEILEGDNYGTMFQTPIGSFTNSNWRFLFEAVEHHFEKKLRSK